MIRVPPLVYNSVIGKELRTRMRGWKSTIVLTVYMLILGAIAIGVLLQQANQSNGGQSSQVGIQLFQVMAVFQLFLIIFITPSSTAGAISGERQRQTWDLLLVTRLSTTGIIWGKLLAGIAFNILLLCASLPVFSLVFLFGGVAPQDIVHSYVVFLGTILLLGVTSLLVSALTRRLAVAMVVSNVVALALGVGITLLTLYLENWGQQTFSPPGPNHPPEPIPLPALNLGAHLDPVVALISALPDGSGGSALGSLGRIHHAFFLPWTLPLWEVFGILSVLVSIGLLALTVLVARHPPRWLQREGS